MEPDPSQAYPWAPWPAATTMSWADSVDDDDDGLPPLSSAFVSSAPDLRPVEPAADLLLDDGFQLVQSRKKNRRGAGRGAGRGAPTRGRGRGRGRGSPRNSAESEEGFGRGRGGAPFQPRTPRPPVRVDFTPKPAKAPAYLSQDAKVIYEILRQNQQFGGATARKIRKVLEANEEVDSRGREYTLEYVGDLLYDELKANKLVYKIGEKGGKWRIVVDSSSVPVPARLQVPPE